MLKTKPKTAKKRATAKTPTENPHVTDMQALKLDDPDLEFIAESYFDGGDDDHAVVTIVLLKRLHDLAAMQEKAPEYVEDIIARMIDRLYFKTTEAENSSEKFAIATSNKFGPKGGVQ